MIARRSVLRSLAAIPLLTPAMLCTASSPGRGRAVLPAASLFLAGQTVNTQLTPNCNARTEATFDLNDTTWVTFYVHDTTPLWMVLLSVATQQVTLDQSITAAGITLQQGLQVTFNAMGSVYTVLLYGTIVDSNTSYRFDGLVLGTFSREPAMKLAVQSIRNGRSSATRAPVSAKSH